jgi:hypothetical protein
MNEPDEDPEVGDRVWFTSREWHPRYGYVDRMRRGVIVVVWGDGSFAIRRRWTRTVLSTIRGRDVIK